MKGISSPPGQTCLLVLGMHRSGTSALTRMLSILGAGLPRTLIGASDGNDTGHWEPLRLVLLHDEMLAEAGSGWNDWRPLDLSGLTAARKSYFQERARNIIAEDFDAAPSIVLKDPRICRFVPFFAEVLAGIDIACRPVLMIRDPLEVFASLRQRNRMGQSPALMLWLRHMLDAEAATRGYQRAFVRFPDLLRDWRRVRDAIVERTGVALAGADTESGRAVDAFLSPGQRHHRAGAGNIGNDRPTGEWIEAVTAQLRVLEREGENPDALRELDRVRREFDHATPLIAGLEEHYQEQYAATVDARVSRGLRLAKSYLRPFSGKS